MSPLWLTGIKQRFTARGVADTRYCRLERNARGLRGSSPLRPQAPSGLTYHDIDSCFMRHLIQQAAYGYGRTRLGKSRMLLLIQLRAVETSPNPQKYKGRHGQP